MRRFLVVTALLASAAIALPAAAQIKGQGVTKDTISVGTYTDLSGPIAIWGVSNRNGMLMRFDEVNAQGGIHGRKIKYIVEDSAYNTAKSVTATDKLLKKDRVFVMVGNVGTAANLATMPSAFKAGVANLFPLTAAISMYEPFEKLKFSVFMTYGDHMRGAVQYFVKEKGKSKVCTLVQDDDFGQDVLRGVDDQLKVHGLAQVERTVYKRGDKEFSSQVARMRAAGCDLLALGTIIAESIGTAAEARKIGWTVDMVVSPAGYAPQVAELAPQGVTEGLYGTGQSPILYADTASPEAKIWMGNYKAKFNRDADLQSQLGYIMADLLIAGLDKAGKDLTTDSLVKGLEAIRNHRDLFGGPPMSFGPDRRLGPDPKTSSTLYQIKNKRWVSLDRLSF
ncbi:MAG: ABC transporter substrate-binding protein [Alphaproteobacteria bacterium]|nr:ABC transporter substrate-binding protein [Alphaproteobacteria bacterium]